MMSMGGYGYGNNLNGLIDKKDDSKKDNLNEHISTKIKSNLLDVRSFTTNQDTLLKRPFRNEIVNPLNRKLHSRSVTSTYNLNGNVNGNGVNMNMNVVSNVKNINVMSTSNANLIHNLGSQGKIQNLNELSHYRQFEI